MTQLTDPKRDTVLSVHQEAREAPGSTPAHLLLAGFAARLEIVGFGQTDDERLVLAWIRRAARLHNAGTEGTTTTQFADAWFRILDHYGIMHRRIPRVNHNATP